MGLAARVGYSTMLGMGSMMREDREREIERKEENEREGKSRRYFLYGRALGRASEREKSAPEREKKENRKRDEEREKE